MRHGRRGAPTGMTSDSRSQPQPEDPPLPLALLADYRGPALLCEPGGTVQAWNGAALEATGRDPEGLRGLDPEELFKGGKKRAFRSRLERARSEGEAELQAPFRTPSGKGPERALRLVRVGASDAGWVLLFGEPEGDGGPDAARSPQGAPGGLCPSLMDALPYGVLVFRGQRLDYANPAAASLLNRGRPEALQGLMMASVVHAEDRERMGQLLGQATENGRADGRLHLLDSHDQPLEMDTSLALLGDPAQPTLQVVFHPITRERGLERALRESEVRYRSLIGSLDEGFWMGGATGGTADVNRALQDLLGYTREEMLDRPLTDFADPGERDRLRAHLNRLEEGRPRSFETRLLHRDGHAVPAGLSMVVMPDPSTGIPALFAFVTDLSTQHSLRERLRRETGLNEAILGNLPGIFFLTGPGLGLTRWNTNLSRQTGHAALDLAGLPAPELFAEDDREAVRALLEAAVDGPGGEIEAGLVTGDGESVPYSLSVAGVGLGEHGFVAALGVDITERKALEADLKRMATVDELTGAWNRAAMDRQLDREVERTRRYGNPLSLVLIDLDHFQEINEHYGRGTGDGVLREMVAWVGANKRATDFLARWSGDQFLLLAPDTDIDGAMTLAENLHHLIGSHDFDPVALVQASIGLTTYQAGDAVTDLVERLEGILHQAKRQGRNQVLVAEG